MPSHTKKERTRAKKQSVKPRVTKGDKSAGKVRKKRQ